MCCLYLVLAIRLCAVSIMKKEVPMELGPLEIIYCWQSLLMSSLIWASTGSLKSLLTIVAGVDRMKRQIVKHVAMPLAPITIGAVMAMVFPFRPEQLDKWADIELANGDNPIFIYIFYGACVGQFADYLHQKLNNVLKSKNENNDLGSHELTPLPDSSKPKS